MVLARRELLARTGLALAAGAIASSGHLRQSAAQDITAPLDPSSVDAWDAVRAQFALSDDFIHMSAMLISSHPKPVRDAIDQYRRGLDVNPITYLHQNNRRLQ